MSASKRPSSVVDDKCVPSVHLTIKSPLFLLYAPIESVFPRLPTCTSCIRRFFFSIISFLNIPTLALAVSTSSIPHSTSSCIAASWVERSKILRLRKWILTTACRMDSSPTMFVVGEMPIPQAVAV